MLCALSVYTNKAIFSGTRQDSIEKAWEMDEQKIGMVLESLSLAEQVMGTRPDAGDVEEVGMCRDVPVRVYNYKEFRELRALSGVGSLYALGNEYVLDKQLLGKSGSFLFFTKDFRFALKTIRRSEFDCIRRMVADYKAYVCENPGSFLCRILGCYSLGSRCMEYFIVMESILKGPGVQEIYDLKGASVKRKGYSASSLKEMDWARSRRRIDLGRQRDAVISQIRSDARFLRACGVMDYSFLVCFWSGQKCYAGMGAGAAADEQAPEDNQVCFGVIDILTQWTLAKRMERMLHVLCCRPNSSCLNPDAYMDRFLVMVESYLFK